jgi:NAD(P)-dependent dehydrogenase (short-subunit alcohol dehydrogenase family)
VAFVTGAGAGIGRGIALRLARDGAHVAVVDVQTDAADAVAAEIRRAGGAATVLGADVGVRSEVEEAVASTLALLGRIDVLVNNAGVIPVSGLFDTSDGEWDRCLGINVTGVFLCTQIVAGSMIDRDIAGRIVNIGSVESVVARRNQIAYGTSKGGALMLTRASALELAEHGITVNAVGPGAIDSGHGFYDADARLAEALARIPLRRIGTPDDVAGAVSFLVGPDASYITGSIVYVDGGVLIE